MAYVQGYYKLINPQKYMGDKSNIFYRSSWEKKAFEICDGNPNIKRWASEEIVIPYLKPTPDGSVKAAKYYPDLYIEYTDKHGNYIKHLIEIKPEKQTKKSKSKKQNVRLAENYVYLINQLKWEAAQNWCNARHIKFSVETESSLFR
jgi:Glu-tRNA(Gln) amidotransferase subunit E-like FAD-binding protein